MSPLLKAGIQSAIIISIVSILFGISTGLIFGYKIGIGITILAIPIQLIIGYIHSVKQEQKTEETADDIANKISNQILQNAAAFKVPIQLTCAYCNVVNRVPISLLDDNGFKCTTCNQPNSILIQFTTSRITQPLAPVIESNLEESSIRQTTINEPIEVQ